jgi:L-fucose mutarotase/ribose pyranase (RbsD/FucU family)
MNKIFNSKVFIAVMIISLLSLLLSVQAMLFINEMQKNKIEKNTVEEMQKQIEINKGNVQEIVNFINQTVQNNQNNQTVKE